MWIEIEEVISLGADEIVGGTWAAAGDAH